MPATLKKNSTDSLIAKLGQLSSEPARRLFLAQHKTLLRQDVVERLAQLVWEKVRISRQEAFHLAEAAVLIAKRLRRKEALAPGLRAMANALYSSGDNRAAIDEGRALVISALRRAAPAVGVGEVGRNAERGIELGDRPPRVARPV